MGEMAILNVGTGDTKLTFDKRNPAECIRAGRIVRDMLRRGYALLIEVDEGGCKRTVRAKDFDENTSEYIIADFDPIEAQAADAAEELSNGAGDQPAAAAGAGTGATQGRKRGRPPGTKRVPAEGTSGVAVARIAGG